MFSGLNLAFFSVSKLQLEIEASQGNIHAQKVLSLRKDSNFLLTTILWGNVGINVLLALLSNSVMTGVVAFLFSTFVITFLGEIIPQAYFSRHALHMAYLLSPALRFYQVLLYPMSKASALILDKWLGHESIHYFRESDLEQLVKMHMQAADTEIESTEGKGILNFLVLDDLLLIETGEPVDPTSIIQLEFVNNIPTFPLITASTSDSFLKKITLSGMKWIIIVDQLNEPRMALNADEFLRGVFLEKGNINPLKYCHRPIILTKSGLSLGEVLPRLKVHPQRSDDTVIDEDLILYWGEEKRVITGADILGRLMKGIVRQQNGTS